MIQLLRGTKSQLETSQTVFADGQPVFEKDTGQLKIGNGMSTYSLLPYVGTSSGGSSSEITYSGDIYEGYIDFPSGLRYSWGEAKKVLNWTDGNGLTQFTNYGYYRNTTTFPFRDEITNRKSVLVDGVITSSENRCGIISQSINSSRTGFIMHVFVDVNGISMTLRWHVWSHD